MKIELDALVKTLNISNVDEVLPQLLKDKDPKHIAWLGEKLQQLNPTKELPKLYRSIVESIHGQKLGILDKYGLTIIQLKDYGAVKLSNDLTCRSSDLVIY